MPNLSSLANIPGYGAYIAKRQMNEQQGMQDIKEASSLLNLRNAIQSHKQDQELRTSLSQSGGDLEAAMQAALRAGRADVAAKLAPIVEARRKAKEGRVVSPGSQVLGQNNEVLHSAPFAPRTPEAQPEIVKLQTFLDSLPPQSPARASIKARIDKLTRDTPAVQVYSGSLVAGVDDQGNPVFVQPSGREGVAPRVVPGVRPPPKGQDSSGLTAEAAGKVAMAQQSVDAISVARGKIFDKDGNINRSLVFKMNIPGSAGLPFDTDARIARSAIRNAVEAKLRLETGAAATQSEIDRTVDRFLPTTTDTTASAEFKLNELEKYFRLTLHQTKGVRPTGPSGGDAKVINFGDLK